MFMFKYVLCSVVLAFIMTRSVLWIAGTTMVDEKSEESYAVQAFKMMQKHKTGMVSTISVGEDKKVRPYGSVMPFALVKSSCCKTYAGSPYVFISDLAVHTKNIKENPYVSIMVFQPDKDGNVFNGSRVTLTGKLVVMTDEKSVEKLKKDYLAEHPDAKDFIDFGDFNFYLLELESIYFIGGFGEIGTVDIDEYRKFANN